MAGIGFEIRKILDRGSFLDSLQAYGYAGLIGSGPWLMSILAMIVVGVMALQTVGAGNDVIAFLVSVTWMMAGSLILTGGVQLLITRYVSDELFTRDMDEILPNVFGALLLSTLAAALLGLAVLPAFGDRSLAWNLLMFGSFVALCDLWVVVIFLSGMKRYKVIAGTMAVGYGLLVVLAWWLAPLGGEGLMLAFFTSQALLLFSFLYFVIRDFPTRKAVEFEFLKHGRAYWSLFVCGSLYNLGVWADKFVFWLDPRTSEPVLGMFRASVIYDVPIFLAYLSIVPGMAIFLVRIETDFVEHYHRYFDGVRGEAPLARLVAIKGDMAASVRSGLVDIVKFQGVFTALLCLWGESILDALGIDRAYYRLLCVDLVGVGVQVIFLCVLNVLFYFDKRWMAAGLTAVFLVANLLLSRLSIELGPAFYGYGFTVAMLIASLVGLLCLDRTFQRLEYETYMFQR